MSNPKFVGYAEYVEQDYQRYRVDARDQKKCSIDKCLNSVKSYVALLIESHGYVLAKVKVFCDIGDDMGREQWQDITQDILLDMGIEDPRQCRQTP